jgi:GT2 family glycosyltransferase
MGCGLPTFSIIVPTFGRPTQLAACLEALTRLDYPHDRVEVVVVDDGSERPPEAAVAAFRDRLDAVLIAQPHAGPATARNTGAAHSHGEILAFTDDDCMPEAGWLRALAARATREPRCAVGGRTLNLLVDDIFATASQLLITHLYDYYNADPNHARFFASNNLAVPAEDFRALGGFDSTALLAAGEDREFCDRWVQRGHRMAYAPDAIVCHAHSLSLRAFWRQHFTYGRGAHYFHRARRQRHARPMRPEPPRFYLDLLRQPLLQRSDHSRPLLMALLALTQAANAAGFVYELHRQVESQRRR